jgi:hypothetical protein
MTRRIGPFAALLCCTTALADGGEVSLTPVVGGEAAFLRYQRPGLELLPTTAQPVAPMGRFGIALGYWLMDELETGIAFNAGLAGGQVIKSVKIADYTGDLYVDHFELTLPLYASYQLAFGWDVNGRLQGFAGPALQNWAERALVDPTKVDGSGLHPRLPADVTTQSNLGFVAGGSVMVDWRVLDWLCLSLGPSGAYKRAGQASSISAGLSLQPTFIFGAGPSF